MIQTVPLKKLYLVSQPPEIWEARETWQVGKKDVPIPGNLLFEERWKTLDPDRTCCRNGWQVVTSQFTGHVNLLIQEARDRKCDGKTLILIPLQIVRLTETEETQ